MADDKERHSKVYNHAEKKKSREKPKEKPAEHKEPDGDEGNTEAGGSDEGPETLATGAAAEMANRHAEEAGSMDKGHTAELKEHADGQRKMLNRHASQRKSMMERHAAEMGGQMAGPAGPPDEGGAPAAEPPAPAV